MKRTNRSLTPSTEWIKAISEHGFAARRMSKSDIKRMLALYFGTSISGDEIPDIEGETEFDLEAKTNEN